MKWVTMFYDLAKYEDNSHRKQGHHYYPLAKQLLSTKVQLAIMCNQETAIIIQAWNEYNPTFHQIVVKEFDQLPFTDYRARLGEARAAKPWVQGVNLKDTPLYTSVIWAKLEILASLITDPHLTYGWVDFGAAGVDDISLLPTWTHTEGDKIKCLCLSPSTDAELSDLDGAYNKGHLAKIAATVMSGTGTVIQQFASAFRQRALELLEQGYSPLEQEIWAGLLGNIVPAAVYYGDYRHCIRNAVGSYGAEPYIISVARSLMGAREYTHSKAMLDWLIPKVTGVQLAQALEINYINNFYRCRSEAKQIAIEIRKLYTNCGPAQHYYHGIWELLYSNLKYLIPEPEVVVIDDIILGTRIAVAGRVVYVIKPDYRGPECLGHNPLVVNKYEGNVDILVSNVDIDGITATRFSITLAAKYLV